MTFRDTRHLQFVERPAEPPVDPALASEHLRAARAFAVSLDALVRALALQSTAVESLLMRATEAAKAAVGQTLHVEASALTLEGDAVLPATPDSGRWVLQAWYAGLRGLTVLPDVRSDDVRVLAAGLAQAAAGAEAVDRLASWLWSTPTDGMRLDLRTAAIERVEAVTGDANASRSALRMAWLDAAARATEGVDPNVPRSAETFARERAWWGRVTTGDLALSAVEAKALRADADDAGALLRMEVMAAMAEEGWQAALPPPFVARLLTRLAATTYDTDLNSLSGLLSSDEGDYGRICVAELAKFPVGAALAQAVPLHPNLTDDELQRLQSLINRLTEPMAAGLLRGLLGRLAEQPDALMPVFGQIAHALTFDTFLKLATPSTLPPATRPLVGRILLAAAPSPEEWAALCLSLPISAFQEVLRATPVESLGALVDALGPALAKADARERTQIVQWLTDPARIAQVPQAALTALIEAFVASGGNHWELRTIRLIADSALRMNYAADSLLEMMRSAKVPPETRVSLLESLARSPAHATEALKWRMGEMFDAPEVRDRLVELRKKRPG
jgi:hypothetical protein